MWLRIRYYKRRPISFWFMDVIDLCESNFSKVSWGRYWNPEEDEKIEFEENGFWIKTKLPLSPEKSPELDNLQFLFVFQNKDGRKYIFD